MIKDKITPELKIRFLDELKKSKESGNERGFILCTDDGKITPSKSCEGDACGIFLKDIVECPKEVQGNFHTHPYLEEAKKELKRRGEKIPSDDVIIKRMSDNIKIIHENKGLTDITINSPTYNDLLHELLGNCIKFSKGTVCTSSDIGESKVECWSVKENIDKDKKEIYCAKAYSESKKIKDAEGTSIEKWIEYTFDRETIDLKK